MAFRELLGSDFESQVEQIRFLNEAGLNLTSSNTGTVILDFIIRQPGGEALLGAGLGGVAIGGLALAYNIFKSDNSDQLRL